MYIVVGLACNVIYFLNPSNQLQFFTLSRSGSFRAARLPGQAICTAEWLCHSGVTMSQLKFCTKQ